MVDRYLTGSQAMLCVRSVCVCACMHASVCVFVCGSTLTPLRGGLARDSMETLSERVSVRGRRRRKCSRGELGRWGRRRGRDGMKRQENENRERCVTPGGDCG